MLSLTPLAHKSANTDNTMLTAIHIPALTDSASFEVAPIITPKVELPSAYNKIYYEQHEKKMIVIIKNYITIFNHNATKILHDVNINIFENNLFDNSVKK